jgi:hypothetical protein
MTKHQRLSPSPQFHRFKLIHLSDFRCRKSNRFVRYGGRRPIASRVVAPPLPTRDPVRYCVADWKNKLLPSPVDGFRKYFADQTNKASRG